MSRVLCACFATTLAWCASACSYDLSRLRGTGDADDVDETAAMDGSDTLDDVVQDPTDVPGDGAPCSMNPPLDANMLGMRVGASLVITGTTTGAPMVLNAPTDTASCTHDYAMQTGPERIYQYVVQQGPTLYATTDAPACVSMLDSVVYIRSTCEPGPANVFACSDDDGILTMCDSTSGLASGAIANGLHAGDTVYVVVDGYGGSNGPFRLVLTENGLPNAVPGSFVSPAADRCSCPDGRSTMLGSTMFPTTADAVTATTGMIQHAGDHISGTHTMPFAHFSGVALEFQLMSNQLGTGAGCSNAAATFDLSIGGHVVQSFVLDAQTPVGTPQRVAFQTFGPIDLAVPATIVSLTLRSTTSGCGGVQFDQMHPGTLTLLGGI